MCNPNSQPENKKPLWPIHPSFLSRTNTKEEVYSPNSDGIFDSDILRGFLADSSDDPNIQNPLTLFQVVDGNVEFSDKKRVKDVKISENDNTAGDNYLNKILGNRKVIRIDPDSLFKNIDCCEKFRNLVSTSNEECPYLCNKLDKQIIILYHENLTNIHFFKDFENYKKKLEELCKKYNESMKFVGEKSSYGLQVFEYKFQEIKRLYVGYQCQYSNLEEYFFPIIHSGKVIAVLMQGQRLPKGIQKNDLFRNYRFNDQELEKKDDEQKIKYQALNSSILGLDNKKFEQEPMGEERLLATFTCIQKLENRINKEVLAYAHSFLSSQFMKIEEDFHRAIKDKEETEGKIEDEHFTPILNKALNNICKIFNPKGFIRLYSFDPSIKLGEQSDSIFSLIGASAYEPNGPIPPRIPFTNLPKDLSEIEGKDLIAYLTSTKQNSAKKIIFVKYEKNDVFRIENLLVGQMKNLIWKKYNTWKNDYPKQYKIYARYLKSMYHTLLEPYYVIRSVELRKEMENSMRYSSHESAQILPLVIKTLQNQYQNNYRHLIFMIGGKDEDKAQSHTIIPTYLITDSINRLTLLSKLLKAPSLVFKSSQDIKSEIQYSWIDIHRIIYSTESLFQSKAKLDDQKYIDIDFPPELNENKLLTNYDLMSHIIFNLVDNAIKYSIRGSNIKVSVKVEIEDHIKCLKISVVNYGDYKIENRVKIFELYYRGKQKETIEGTGMGLYIVKKLSSLLGFNIECLESELKSEGLNLPFICQFKRLKKKLDLDKATQEKLIREIEPSLINEIVNKDIKDWDIGRRELTNNINADIYKNEFVITIPINDQNFK